MQIVLQRELIADDTASTDDITSYCVERNRGGCMLHCARCRPYLLKYRLQRSAALSPSCVWHNTKGAHVVAASHDGEVCAHAASWSDRQDVCVCLFCAELNIHGALMLATTSAGTALHICNYLRWPLAAVGDDVPHVSVTFHIVSCSCKVPRFTKQLQVMDCVVNSHTGIVGSTRALPTSIVSSSLGISL